MVRLNKALLGGSLILLITFNLYNAINFLFQFSMARLLSIPDYGVLATLYSIIYITGIFSESLQTIMVKYTSAEKDKGKIKNIIKRSLKKALQISIGLFGIYLLFAIFLNYILDIPYTLIAITGLMIILSFIIPITRGALLGKKMFGSLGLNLIVESISKLLVSIGVIYIGWRVYGVMIATILSIFTSFVFSLFSLRSIIKSKEKPAKVPDIYSYGKPVFFITLFLLVFFSSDVIIAKIVFDDHLAGTYAIASILAKTIFLATQPIGKAMFPLSAENKENKKKSNNIILTASLVLAGCLIMALFAFYVFPSLLITIFSGKQIPESASILLNLGVGMSFLSLTNLIVMYKMSHNAVRGYGYLAIFPALEVLMLFTFSGNIIDFSLAFIAASIIFLIGSLLLLNE